MSSGRQRTPGPSQQGQSDQGLLHNQMVNQMAGQIQQQRAVLVSALGCRWWGPVIGEGGHYKPARACCRLPAVAYRATHA